MIKNGKNIGFLFNDRVYHCGVSITDDYIGGKWKAIVLWYLKEEPLRYSELRKRIPDITEKMLNIQLRKLEASGLVMRKVQGTKPPLKVEYALTEFGKTLIPVLDAIANWGWELG
ncbi:helix-turn-helix transcriptional regulator, partial [Sinomicrobium sp. 2019215]|uniref:winged helix-turn-helix transcriptional regulator n=1 Tax=Sinomicrobium weinanense TaxID=2842200 RepID=UPI001C0D1BC0